MRKTLASEVIERHEDFISGLRIHRLKKSIQSIQNHFEATILFELVNLMISSNSSESKRLSPLLKLIKAKLNQFEFHKANHLK